MIGREATALSARARVEARDVNQAWWWSVVVVATVFAAGCASQAPSGDEGQEADTGSAATDTGSGGASDTGAVDAGDVGGGEDAVADLGVDAEVPTVDPLACEPTEEVCDAIDNDCDGEVDEIACVCTDEVACYGGTPQTRGVGECHDGTRECANGEFFGACEGWRGSEPELCRDGLDNDCDAVEDEANCEEPCRDGETRSCWPGEAAQDGVGACQRGEQACLGDSGRWGACEGALLPEEEACDLLDNDCDGFTDEVCCLEEELCGDGEDTDCDGEFDEGCPIPTEEAFVVGELAEARPVDVMLVVDNSDSMADTVAEVEANLARFAERMVRQGIDYRVVMISERGPDPDAADVCVPPPLGGPNCGDGERFLHLDHRVGSHSAFEDILACLGGCGEPAESFFGFLRPQALLQIIVVTDDESDTRWDVFRDEMVFQGLAGFILHAVVGLRLGGCALRTGDRYIDGALETMGELLHVCDNDWGEVIDVIFDATVMRLQSTYPLAEVPVEGSVRVFVAPPGGVEEERLAGWSWDPVSNAVVFDPAAVPPLGHRIVVRYLVPAP